MTSYAAEGLERTLVHAHSGMVAGQGRKPPTFDPALKTEQHHLWRAIGRWRDTEAQARGDLALLNADADIVGALRELLFLAGEAVGDDPDDTEVMALVRISALVDLLEVAAG
jgi:hypothetical protein